MLVFNNAGLCPCDAPALAFAIENGSHWQRDWPTLGIPSALKMNTSVFANKEMQVLDASEEAE